MTEHLYWTLPRLVYIAISVYALILVAHRWRATRVMTQERRFLWLFFVLELVTVILSGTLKTLGDTPGDASIWLTVLTQGFLASYLHYAIPREHKRPWHRFTRRRPNA